MASSDSVAATRLLAGYPDEMLEIEVCAGIG
jgi:hypothetical protein